MYKIGTFNKISPVGLNNLTDDYVIVEDQNEAHGIILRSYDMHEMDFSDELLAIGRAGAGTNNVPVDRCSELGIVVFNAPGANANAVKELCICGMIMAARNVPDGIAWAKTLKGSEGVGKQIEKGKGQFAGTEIMGKTLGIIGLGAIGRLVADSALALGMNVIGYDAFLTDAVKAQLPAEVKVVDDLAQLYPECDYVSIHVPANDATKGMMNAEAFAQMKDGVIFLNFARDKLMNDDDLLAALASGKIAKYVTDFADDAVESSCCRIWALPPQKQKTTAQQWLSHRLWITLKTATSETPSTCRLYHSDRRRTALVSPSSAKPAQSQMLCSSSMSCNLLTSFLQHAVNTPTFWLIWKTRRLICRLQV